jgi:Galactosyltransferase
MKKLIAIMSCHHKCAWANAQRQTWVKDIVARGYADVKFFLGRPDYDEYAGPELDEIWLPVSDGYRSIPLKVKLICQWAVEHGYDLVAKCDDDVYIIPDRFPALPLGGDYVGRFRTPYGKVYPVHFASGFFYCLTRRAAEIVANTPWNGDWMDERFVATSLAYRGLFGYTDAVSYLVTGPHVDAKALLPNPTFNRGTVFCEYNPASIRALHEELKNVGPCSAPHPGLIKQPEVVVTAEMLASPPGDDVPQHKLNRTYHV